MTDMTDMMEVTSMKNVASEMTAAFSGDEPVKLFARVQIPRFAVVLMRVSSIIMRSNLNLAAAVLLGLGTIVPAARVERTPPQQKSPRRKPTPP